MLIISYIFLLNLFFNGVFPLFISTCDTDISAFLSDPMISSYTLGNSSCSFKISAQSLTLNHTFALDAINSTLEITNSNLTLIQNSNFSNLLIIASYTSDFVSNNGSGYLFNIKNCVVLFEVTVYNFDFRSNFVRTAISCWTSKTPPS